MGSWCAVQSSASVDGDKSGFTGPGPGVLPVEPLALQKPPVRQQDAHPVRLLALDVDGLEPDRRAGFRRSPGRRLGRACGTGRPVGVCSASRQTIGTPSRCNSLCRHGDSEPVVADRAHTSAPGTQRLGDRFRLRRPAAAIVICGFLAREAGSGSSPSLAGRTSALAQAQLSASGVGMGFSLPG